MSTPAYAADPLPRLTGWTDGGDKVVNPVPNTNTANQTQHAVLMPVADKLSAPFDAWYLWIWTHDAKVCRLFSAPSPRGDVMGNYQFRGYCSFPPNPAGWDPVHFSAGDVVWDQQAQMFFSSPHLHRLYNGYYQATFLITSADGLNWSFVKTSPIIQWGLTGTFDDHQVSYGRFLRDYAGNLHRRPDGRAVFFYRGEKNIRPNRIRQIGAATSLNLSTWTKANGGRALFNAQNGNNIQPGSALQVGSSTYLELAALDCPQAECNVPLTTTHYLKQAVTAGDPFTWLDGMGTPIYRHLRHPAHDGASYVVDGDTHYLAFAVIPTDGNPATPYKVALASSTG